MKKVEITYMDSEMKPTQKITFVNVVKIRTTSKNLILYFKDGTTQKISNNKWFGYVEVNC